MSTHQCALLGILWGCTAGSALVPRVDAGADAAPDSQVADAGQPDSGRDAMDPPDGCTPRSCAEVVCGELDDGCGGTLTCGSCGADESCVEGACEAAAVDCSGIAAQPGLELCQSDATTCAGVFTDGSGCNAYCAAAGLTCVGRFGGDAGCRMEAEMIACDASNGHASDWCVCQASEPGPDPTCAPDGRAPTAVSQGYREATFSPRSSWVLDCRAYAYTAQFAEHMDCDSQYREGSGRGTATFRFEDVPAGTYDVFVEGRHTANRNPAGALVVVRSRGAEHRATISQRDEGGVVQDLHGRYCLSGAVEVVVDSSVNAQSDSVSRVLLVPAS